MDEQMEKVIALAGNQNRYQYFTLAVVVFLWVNCNFISCVLTFLERPPLVNYTYNNVTYENQILSNDLCNEFVTNKLLFLFETISSTTTIDE